MEMSIRKNTYLALAFLMVFYVLFCLPPLLAVKSFAPLVFPLNSIYIANQLLFNSNGLNANLADTIVAPSNMLFVQPPGIYLLTKVLGSVRNMFYFLFAIQSFLPVFIFFLYRTVATVPLSFGATLITIFLCTNTNWWSPDWIIQPFMVIAIIFLLTGMKKEDGASAILFTFSGVLAGIIMILKHNIGLFFVISCLTGLFLNSLTRRSQINRRSSALLFWFIITGYIGFGILFTSKVLFVDEFAYYLVPYFCFWALFLYARFKRERFDANFWNTTTFIRRSLAFILGFLLLPLLVFLWIGGVVGYDKYWHSLFGMGFEYLPIWDHGIIGILKHHLIFSGFTELLMGLIISSLFLLPLMVNSLASYILFTQAFSKNRFCGNVNNDLFEISSLSIIGIFMFFPLEGYHISSTKLFIYIYVLLYLQSRYRLIPSPLVKIVASGISVLVIIIGTGRAYGTFNSNRTYGSNDLKSKIALPLDIKLADALDKQIATIKRHTQNADYYVIDSAGATLASLLAFTNNHSPQYYLEMRNGILNQEVTNAILHSLGKSSYVVVNLEDYSKFLRKESADPFYSQIMDFVNKQYTIIDQYEQPEGKVPLKHIHGFLVMKNNSAKDAV